MNINENSTESTSTLPPPKPRRRKWRLVLQLLLILVIFCCGFVAGGALTFRFARQRMQHFEQNSERMIDRIHRQLVWKYDLSDAQSMQAKEAVRKNINDFAELRREFRPKLAMRMATFEEDIAAIMDDVQEEKWRKNFRHFCELTFPGVYQPDKEPQNEELDSEATDDREASDDNEAADAGDATEGEE